MENIKLLDCVYEYVIDECMVLDKSLSKNNVDILYKILNDYGIYKISEQIQSRIDNYIFNNWDFLDRFKIKYNIDNLYYIPNTNCMQQVFQEKINISQKDNEKFYLVFKSYLGHYSLLYVERQKGRNYSYCFDSVYGSVNYQPNDKLINILKENNTIFLYQTAKRQCTGNGCFTDALTIARDIDNLDLDISYMYQCHKNNVIMPFLLTHIERYDTLNILKEQLNKYECYNYVFIPKYEPELNLSMDFDNLKKCNFIEKKDGYIININDLFINNVLISQIRTKKGEDYDFYQCINDINTKTEDFVLVNFPERDDTLRSMLEEDIELLEMKEEIKQNVKKQIETKIKTELKIILNYHNIYEPNGTVDTILYFNLCKANDTFGDSKYTSLN